MQTQQKKKPPVSPTAAAPDAARRRGSGMEQSRTAQKQMLPKQRRSAPPTRAELEARENAQYVRVYTGIDRPFLILVLALLAFGIVMGFSASYSYASYKYDDAFYYFRRNLMFAAIGVIAMFLCLYIPIQGFELLTGPAYFGSLALLALVFVPGIGVAEGEAVRWIRIPGIGLSFQPSEIAKLGMIMALAWFISKYYDKITSRDRRTALLWGFCGCGCIVGLIAVGIMLEHHVSGMMIVGIVGGLMMLVGQVRKPLLILLALLLVMALVLSAVYVPYVQRKFFIWQHVEDEEITKEELAEQGLTEREFKDAVYQNQQGLYAIGSGGIFGVGLGNSIQKFGYVPQPQNDFIFSIICEELGFLGAAGVILLFVALAWRGYIIARNAPNRFSSMLVFGIMIQVTLQALLNICVVTNTIPNTGISLPFFSSGGTSLVILMVEMGVVLSISRYSYQKRT